MATYKIKTKRYIRKYTAAEKLPVSAALIDAQRVVDELCNVPWEQAAATTAVITAHDESELDANVSNRDRFDAALFCADHANGAHSAYANAACYKIPFPTGTAGKKITSLKVRVTSDAYNAAGARIALVTNSTGVIPTSCAECRGEGSGGIHAAGVAPQTIQTVGGQRYGYPTIADCIFNVTPGEGEHALPEGGLTLGSYLYVFVLMENYNSVRGNWLEGSSCIVNQIEIVTNSSITGWTDGGTIDLTADPTKEFNVVKGGVMAKLPDGDAGIRSLTLQRTGYEFVRNRVISDTGLFGRPRVDGLRVLDATSTDAVFRSSLFSGSVSGVHVLPALTNLVGSSSSTDTGFAAICGNFADGTFPDLQGLLICGVKTNGTMSPLKTDVRLDSIAVGSDASRLADLKSAIDEDGGIAFASVLRESGSPAKYHIFIHTKNRTCLSGGSIVEALIVTWGANPSAVTVGPAMTEVGDIFLAPYRMNYSNFAQTNGHPFVIGDGEISSPVVSAMRVSFVGMLTAIRPVNFSTDLNTPAFIVSGQFQSVGGVSCSNCAIVRFPNFGSPVVTVPACDNAITPDTYRNFAVSCPCTFTPNVSTFFVTGGFRKLGDVDVDMAAKWSNGSLSTMTLPEGTRPPEYFLLTNSVGGTADALWIDDTGPIQEDERAVDVYETPLDAVTDAQSAFGLRTLYSRLSLGSLSPIEKKDIGWDDRPGAAFCIRGETINVKTGLGVGDVVQAKCWNLSASVLVVPFSCPRDFLARKIRLEWNAVAATSGAMVNVWLKRGGYEGYPTSYPKAIFTCAAKSIGGWELVGKIEPEDDTSGSVELDVSPLDCDVATLLFTAFVSQDGFNPASDMTLPRGIGNIKINSVSGEVSGLDSGFRPDITLIG